MQGVENYLARVLYPVAGDEWPNAYPIQVNLPTFEKPRETRQLTATR